MARIMAMLTKDESGNPTAEYWHGDKKLTLYFEADSVRYRQAWRLPASPEFEEGALKQAEALRPLLEWLLKEPA